MCFWVHLSDFASFFRSSLHWRRTPRPKRCSWDTVCSRLPLQWRIKWQICDRGTMRRRSLIGIWNTADKAEQDFSYGSVPPRYSSSWVCRRGAMDSWIRRACAKCFFQQLFKNTTVRLAAAWWKSLMGSWHTHPHIFSVYILHTPVFLCYFKRQKNVLCLH